MAAATLSVGVLLAILEAAPEIRVPFRVDSHHSSKLGGKSQGGRRDRNQPYRESPQRECITLDRTPHSGGAIQSDAAMLSIRESREAWHMAAAKLSDEAFSAILEAHPGLRERFASIAMAVANSGENLKEADAIEERIVEEMRLLGREAMQGWAETQVKATEKEIRQQPSMHRQGKKNSAGIRNLAKSRF
jgi:hypothetical protein